jgi:mannose-6-phosphate isomerase-like protein (cupin superfamily)
MQIMTEKVQPREINRIQPVVDSLRQILHDNVKPRLDAKLRDTQAVDPKAGIVIAPLEEVPGVENEGQTYQFYAARVLPPSEDNPKCYVIPHYHLHGQEPYRFLAGTDGEMNTGRVVDGKVEWNSPKTVQPGDEVVIQEGEVHSFRNNGSEPYDFIFACPITHLIDNDPQSKPDGDRYIVKDLPNGIPPHYPQKKG